MRAKFRVATITRHAGMPGESVTLSPVYSSDPHSENHAFWSATPNGKVEMTITNPQACGVFELGAEYYLDFARADVEARA